MRNSKFKLQNAECSAQHGREAIARAYQAFFHSFPDVTLKNEAPLIDGHRVVLITRISGTDSGGFLGMHPTGRSVDFPCVLIYQLDNGLIVRERRIYDFTGLAVQVGRRPPSDEELRAIENDHPAAL